MPGTIKKNFITELEAVYTKYRTYFVDIATSYVRDRAVAEDMVADTFLKLLEGQDKTTPLNLPAYLYVALKHRCLDWLRDECRHLKAQENIQGTSLEVIEERLSRLEADEPQSLLLLDAVEIVKRELRKMPVQRRKVFLAHRFEEMSYKEISRLYNLTEGQIAYEIRTAKEILKAALKDYPTIVLLLLGLL